MSAAYDFLRDTGFVGSLKRDVLLEATRDIEYLSAIRGAFKKAGNDASEDAAACTVRLVCELVDSGFCGVATWSERDCGSHANLEVDAAEVERLVALVENDREVFSFFLVATKAGEDWVARYDALIDELE